MGDDAQQRADDLTAAIANQGNATEARFVVWGTGQVPQWLLDYGAVELSDADAAAALDLTRQDVVLLFDWVVGVNAYRNDMQRYGELDDAVTNWTEQTGDGQWDEKFKGRTGR